MLKKILKLTPENRNEICLTHVIPALREPRQKEDCKVKVSLGCVASSMPAV